MTYILYKTFSNTFPWMKIIACWFKFQCRLFLWVQLTLSQQWLRQWLGTKLVTSHYLNQWRSRSVMPYGIHYNDVIMSVMVSQITSLMIVYSIVYSRRKSKKKSKLSVTALCEGNLPVTGEFPAQRASNVESVSIWWHHHALGLDRYKI